MIGIGGGGCNAVRHMIASNVDGVDFICANTDAQSLNDMPEATILQLGDSLTKGLVLGQILRWVDRRQSNKDKFAQS